MTDSADNTMIMHVLQKVQASQARLELQVTDLVGEVRRMNQRVSMHAGDIGSLRHDTDVIAARYRDLEARMRALEETVTTP